MPLGVEHKFGEYPIFSVQGLTFPKMPLGVEYATPVRKVRIPDPCRYLGCLQALSTSRQLKT